jgi:hypothetical protein
MGEAEFPGQLSDYNFLQGAYVMELAFRKVKIMK